MPKQARNPANSVKRYREMFQPILELFAYQLRYCRDQMSKDEFNNTYLPLHGRTVDKLKASIAAEILDTRTGYFNDAQKVYFLKLLRSWMLVNHSYLNQYMYDVKNEPYHTSEIFLSFDILNKSPRMMDKFLKIVHDAISYGGDQEFRLLPAYITQLKAQHHDPPSHGRGVVHDIMKALMEKVIGDYTHFFRPAKNAVRLDAEGVGQTPPAMLWYIHHIANWKPLPNMPYTASTDCARDQLSHIEDQYNELRAEGKYFIDLRAETHHKPFLKVDDDWVWFAVDAGYCEKTGAIMGHCGNEPSVTQGDILLNLGKFYKEGYIPHLTFILNKGVLGEMKGKANSKPAMKYHPQIMRLLLDPRVIWISGGGYAAQSNFAVDDLAPKYKAYLKKHRLDLVDKKAFIDKRKNDPDILELLQKNNDDIANIFNVFDFSVITHGKEKYLESKYMSFSTLLKDLKYNSLVDDISGIEGAMSCIGETTDVHYRASTKEKNEIAILGIKEALKKKYFRRKKGKYLHGEGFRKKLKAHLKLENGKIVASEQAQELAESAIRDLLEWDASNDAEESLHEEIVEGVTRLGFSIEMKSGDYVPDKKSECRISAKLSVFIADTIEFMFSKQRLDNWGFNTRNSSEFGSYTSNKWNGRGNGFGDDQYHDEDEYARAFRDRLDELLDAEPTFD